MTSTRGHFKIMGCMEDLWAEIVRYCPEVQEMSKVYVCGGFIRSWYEHLIHVKNFKPKDMDLWFKDREDAYQAINVLINIGYWTKVNENKACVTFVGTEKKMVQVCWSDFGEIKDILDGFDLTVTQAGVKIENRMMYQGMWFYTDIKHKIIRITPSPRRFQLGRLTRYNQYGYHMTDKCFELMDKKHEALEGLVS